MSASVDIVIVGGGLSGLIAALEVKSLGLKPLVLEAGPEIGGRIATDSAGGFLFDRGFQILLAGYPWVQDFLDLDQLDFRPVKSGALIWDGKKFERMMDPIRHPSEISSALTTPVLRWGDRIRLGKLAASLYPHAPRPLLAHGGGKSTAQFLNEFGFSETAQSEFLRPFFSGIFLDPELRTASSLFRFLFRVFGTGPAGVPAAGMGAIPRQLAAKLGAECIRLRAPVAAVKKNTVYLESGEVISARSIILAVDQQARARLLPPKGAPRPWAPSITLYFAAPSSPVKENILVLNGSGKGFVNSLLVLTELSPQYAPPGQTLISVSLLKLPMERAAAEGESLARSELKEWFGDEVDSWKMVRSVCLPQALPAFLPGTLPGPFVETDIPGVFSCGDDVSIPSQDGAAHSGQRAAQVAAAFARA